MCPQSQRDWLCINLHHAYNRGMLKVMTSNIRFSSPHDGPNSWDQRKSLLTTVIHDFHPHILGTQEGREPQLRELHQMLKGLTLVDSHREWIEERMYPCLFMNLEEIELIQSGDFWLSETPNVAGSLSFESAFPRLCVWAKIVVKNTQRTIMVVNTHLDHVKSETRQNQMRVMLEQVQQINTQNLPMLFMGDFNESPFGPTRKVMNTFLSELYDPWQKLKYEEETTYHKFRGQLSEEEGGARIDWIMASPEFKVHSIEIEKKHRDQLYPSDHFPIKAEFSEF